MQTGTIYRPELPYSASAPAVSTNKIGTLQPPPATPAELRQSSLFNENANLPFSATNTVPVDPEREYVLPNGITIYGDLPVAHRLAKVTENFNDVFTDQGTTYNIPEEDWMPIPLKPGASLSLLKVYNLSQVDRVKLDETFDKLY